MIVQDFCRIKKEQLKTFKVISNIGVCPLHFTLLQTMFLFYSYSEWQLVAGKKWYFWLKVWWGLFILYFPNTIVFSLCQLFGVCAYGHVLTALASFRSFSNSYSLEIAILDDTKTSLIPRTTVIQQINSYWSCIGNKCKLVAEVP